MESRSIPVSPSRTIFAVTPGDFPAKAVVVPPPESLPRPTDHHQEWVDACMGKDVALSNFGYSAVLTESLLLGNVARPGEGLGDLY